MADATVAVPAEGEGAVFPARFEILDACRGLAALAVVVHHTAAIYIGGPAVMVFFVISGYCISAAADSCRKAGLGMRGFFWRRFRRIYPPYLLSLLFWAATRVIKLKMDGVNDLARPGLEWLQNVTLTQWVTLLFHPAQYPPNNPTLFVGAYWSLCYEEQFYIVMGLMATAAWLSAAASRWMVVGLLAAGLAWNFVFPRTVYGVFIEYWAPFALGVLVHYRLCVVREGRGRRAIEAGLAAVCIGSVIAFIRMGGFPAPMPDGSEVRTVAGELMVASIFALWLLAVRRADAAVARAKLFAPLRWLGKITFSLYLIHQFNLSLADKVSAWVLRGHNDGPAGFVVTTGFLVALGAVFWYFCERPFLNKPLSGTRR